MLSWTDLYYASEWLIRLVMLVYVPRRRSPAAARTWLLLIFLVPWVGLALYAILGRPYLPRRRVELENYVADLLRTRGQELFGRYTTAAIAPNFARTVALAEQLGNFPIVGGNQIELIDDYDAAIDGLVADIDTAQHHVHLLYYIFGDDRTANRVADALRAAAGRGVHCRVLVDSHGSKVARKRLLPRMRAAGIDVHEVLRFRWRRRDRARIDLRNHRKIAVIDGRVAYVGSQNIVDADFKRGLVYEELVARVTGPAVAEIQVIFLTDHFIETETRLDPADLLQPHDTAAGGAAAQVLPSGPGYPNANVLRMLIALIHEAQRRVVITTPYFVPDEPLLLALETAAQRGVEVHLVVTQQIDQPLVGAAQRSYYDELLVAGVRIHEYRPRFLHAKHVTIDDSVAIVGSSNIDLRSFLLNAEISLLVYDAACVARLREVEERNIAAAEEITLDQWRRRPGLVKVAQNTARLVDVLL